MTERPSGSRTRAIDRLPTPYAVALRLWDSGMADDTIADALGIDPRSVPSLLELAEAKLARIERDLDPGLP
jgi:hypothetical protein